MSVASITVLMSCLIVMGSFALLVLNINYNMEELGNLNAISAFALTENNFAENGEALIADKLKAVNGDNQFMGWSLDPNDTEPTYAPKQIYTVNPADARGDKITLYAVWSVKPQTNDYGVVYDMSGVGIEGQVPVDENRYNHGSDVTLAGAPVPQFSSNTFLGWSTSPGTPESQGSIIPAGSVYKLNSGNAICGTVTFYAVWSKMPIVASYKIIYSANRTEINGTVPTQEQVIRDDIADKIGVIANNDDNVERIELIPKEQALAEEKERYAEFPGLVNSLLAGGNFYPDNFIITYRDNSRVETLRYQLENTEGIYRTTARVDLATSIEHLKNGVIIIFTWFLVLLLVVSIFIIMNTVKLAVFTRKQEIATMRWVGATNWFISLPFLIEGALIGIFSSGLAYLIEWYIYIYLQKRVLSDAMRMIRIISFSNISSWLLFGFAAIGILTGVIGSLISMRRYLKA